MDRTATEESDNAHGRDIENGVRSQPLTKCESQSSTDAKNVSTSTGVKTTTVWKLVSTLYMPPIIGVTSWKSINMEDR